MSTYKEKISVLSTEELSGMLRGWDEFIAPVKDENWQEIMRGRKQAIVELLEERKCITNL